jgi:hypothetical protein
LEALNEVSFSDCSTAFGDSGSANAEPNHTTAIVDTTAHAVLFIAILPG